LTVLSVKDVVNPQFVISIVLFTESDEIKEAEASQHNPLTLQERFIVSEIDETVVLQRSPMLYVAIK